MAGIYIGQILVEQGVLTQEQVSHILEVQKTAAKPFGDLAERLYGLDPKSIEDAWVEQYARLTGVVDLEQLQIDEQCLRVINRRQAWQFHMLPCFREDDQLHVATDVDNLVRALNFSTRRVDEAVYFQLAQREQLFEFLMKHYPVPEYLAHMAVQL